MEQHKTRLLPEVMRRNGYETRGVSCNLWISPESGFDLGFDEFVAVDGPRTTDMVTPGVSGHGAVGVAVAAVRRTTTAPRRPTRILGRFLDERSRRPFFWFVNLVECHSPYLPPRTYDDLGTPIARVRPGWPRKHMHLGAIWKACLGGFDISDRDLELLRHYYERSIRWLDDWIARFLEDLDRRGVLDETIVVVTSDHGENFGEGRLIGHSFSLDDRLIRVPFVAAGPGVEGIDRVASLVELPALLAGLVDIDDHPWGAAGLRDGIAVAQFDAPSDRDEKAQSAVDGWGLGTDALDLLTSDQTAVTDGAHKLVRRAGADVLFDLGADPAEARPLPATEASSALRSALDEASSVTAEVTSVADAQERSAPTSRSA